MEDCTVKDDIAVEINRYFYHNWTKPSNPIQFLSKATCALAMKKSRIKSTFWQIFFSFLERSFKNIKLIRGQCLREFNISRLIVIWKIANSCCVFVYNVRFVHWALDGRILFIFERFVKRWNSLRLSISFHLLSPRAKIYKQDDNLILVDLIKPKWRLPNSFEIKFHVEWRNSIKKN